jgi:hypothetical protein
MFISHLAGFGWLRCRPTCAALAVSQWSQSALGRSKPSDPAGRIGRQTARLSFGDPMRQRLESTVKRIHPALEVISTINQLT